MDSDSQRLSRDVMRLAADGPFKAQPSEVKPTGSTINFISPQPWLALNTTSSASYTKLNLSQYVPAEARWILVRIVYGYVTDANEKKLTVKPTETSQLEMVLAWAPADASGAEQENSFGVTQAMIPVGIEANARIIWYKIDAGFDVRLYMYVDGWGV